MKSKRSTFGALDIWIILLTIATALIHMIGLNIVMGKIDPLFTLNGLGYLGLLAAIYLPLPLLGGLHRWAPYLLMAFTAVTILAWVVMGKPYTPIGYITKAIEAALIILLFLKTRQS